MEDSRQAATKSKENQISEKSGPSPHTWDSSDLQKIKDQMEVERQTGSLNEVIDFDEEATTGPSEPQGKK
jgi:hypothetical protein